MNRKPQQYDLTRGSILQKLLLIALPIMGSQLMQMSYNLTDMFWLGRWGNGSDAVAASGTAGMYLWLAQALVVIGRTGTEIGVSQGLGRQDERNAKKFAQNSLFLSALLGVTYALCMILFRVPLVGFFNIQEIHVAHYTQDYLLLVGLSLPFTFLSSALTGCFNASGNSRTPFLVTTLGLVLNMVLDPLMIFIMNWGIHGAAVATALSQSLVCLLMVIKIKTDKNRPFQQLRLFIKPRYIYVRQILQWGIPIGLEGMFFTLMSMVTSRLVAGFGITAMAVSRVGTQIESLTWLIGGGYGSALTAFVGQNYGGGKWIRIHRGFTLSVGAMSLWGLLVTALIYFGGGLLFSVFLPDAAAIEMGAVYLRILAVCQLPQCLEAVAASTFKGTGRTLPPSVISIASNLLRVALAYWFAGTSLGLVGIWWAIALSASFRGIGGFVWWLLTSKQLPKTDVCTQ